MKNYLYKSGMLALFASVLFTSCDPEIEAPAVSAGEADFSTYVALGNSLTAGFQDGALYREGQQTSYPAILAGQFAMVGGDDTFRQPLFPENASAGSPRPNAQGQIEVPQRLVLRPVENCVGVTSLSPVEEGAPGTMGAYEAPTEQGPYNNMGVPGAKAVHLLAPGYGSLAGLATGTANPFFVRMATSQTTSILADAMAQDPTFFTLWIGNNDVLGYALTGGTGEEPTNGTAFRGYIQTILTQLTANNAKGAVGNIPDVSKIPYFTTIPYNGLNLTAAQAAQLTAGYAAQGMGHITFSEGANAFVVLEDGVPRKIKSTEYILLPASSSLTCEGAGSMAPLADRFVLSEEELVIIRSATESYNASLKAEADSRGLAHVDFNAYLTRLSSGFTLNGINYNAALVTGNSFSLDGIHFTPRGAALVANEFIRAINTTYNSRIPAVDETKYRAVLFP